MQVNPYLNFPGNAEEAMNFYKEIFGGELNALMRFKEMPPIDGAPVSPEDGEKIMHAGLPIGKDTVLMASDVLEAFGQKWVPGNNNNVSIHPTSKAEADRIFKALSDGAEIDMPIEDQFWGDYFGSLKDKFGICWMVNYNDKNVE